MAEVSQRVRVMQPHITSAPDPVRFVTGEALSIGHHDQQWRSYVWCTDQSGRAGWVPDFYLEMTGAHEATALRDYDATELTVGSGKLLDVLEEVGGWLRCRTSSGNEGWVPGDNVESV
ncbi:MAG: SH3 domain-containing protein [Actinobacteria bacterium]|nr:SH3 domain-containing protein [Actinomycetota bacterium]